MAGGLVESLKRGIGSRFARDAFYLQIGSGVTMAAGIFTSVALFRLFGAEGYGRYAEAINLYTLLYFLGNVGFSNLTIAKISEAMGRRDPDGVALQLGFFAKAFGLFGVAIAIVGFAAGPTLGVWIADDVEVGWWAAFLSLSGILSLPFYLVQCALQGTRRMRFLAEMENIKEIMRVYCVVLGAAAWGDVRGAIAGEVLGTLFSIPLAVLSYRKGVLDPGMQLPGIRRIARDARATPWSEVWLLARTGALLSVNKNFQALMTSVLPRLLLSHYADSRDVGYFNLAQNLMKVPLLAFQGVSRTIMPVLGQLRGAGDESRLRRFLVKIMLLSGAAMTVLSASFGLLLYFFMPVLYGEESRPALALLPWFFIAMVISGFAVGSEAFFIVVERVHIAVRISMISVGLTLPFGFWLIPAWHAEGAAAFIALVHISAAASVGYVFHYFRTSRHPA
jgi:O-antigen/teichoic acid export membrane protein